MKKIPLYHKNFETLFNDKMSDYVKKKITSYKLSYSKINKREEEQIIIKIVDTLLNPFVVYSGPHRLKQWEKGWGQNLHELNDKKTKDAILPHYFSKYTIQRLKQGFVRGVSKDYEKNMLYVILDYVFDKYFRKVKNIYEFGCGTGYILLKASEVNPYANLFGLDWTRSSQKIIKKISDSKLHKNIKGHNFNFFRPDNKIKIAENSAVYTVAALEQTGQNYKAFVSCLLENKPEICINIEPIAELLDPDRFIDNLAIKYFHKRNYLSGYLDYLKKLEKDGRIKIIEAKRTYIGSMFVEGHSIMVWKPLP